MAKYVVRNLDTANVYGPFRDMEAAQAWVEDNFDPDAEVDIDPLLAPT